MIKYLVLKNLRAPRINASNHVQVGIPGPGAFHGLAYVVTKTLNALEQRDRAGAEDLAHLASFAVAVSAFSLVNARKKFVPVHDDDKPATPMGMVDDWMGDITFSLVLELEFQGDGVLPDVGELKALMAAQRFAGSYLDTGALRVWSVNDKQSALSLLRGRAFLLRDLSAIVAERIAAGATVVEVFKQALAPEVAAPSPSADWGPAAAASLPEVAPEPTEGLSEPDVLALLEGTSESPVTFDDATLEALLGMSDQPIDFDGTEPGTSAYEGWILPSLVGYRLLESPRLRAGARGNFPHAFAEPIVGLLRAQLVGSVLKDFDRHGEWPEVFFQPRETGDLLLYSAVSAATFARITANLSPA